MAGRWRGRRFACVQWRQLPLALLLWLPAFDLISCGLGLVPLGFVPWTGLRCTSGIAKLSCADQLLSLAQLKFIRGGSRELSLSCALL
jgi:hypothetical protein